MSASTAGVDIPEQRPSDALWSVEDTAAYLRGPPKTLYGPPTAAAGTSATAPPRSVPGSAPADPGPDPDNNPRKGSPPWPVPGSTTAPRKSPTWRP